MAVRIAQSKTYRTSVNFSITTENGKKENSSFEAQFKRLTLDEVKEWSDLGGEDVERLKRVLVGWKMVTPEGDDVPFSDENVDKVCQAIPGIAGVMVYRFIETVAASREKN